MSNFALDVNSSQGDIVSSLNYALSNLGTASAYSSGNVLTANVQTGAITTGGNTVAYLYQYMNVAYGNSATGSGFTSNSYHTTYYGIHNNTANVADTNPADYQWTQVSGGFGTTKQLYYQTLGGRQISFDVNTVAPKYFSPVQDNTPINLDIVTGTTGANGTSGISTYYYPVYATGNTVPYTPVSINGTGNWNFGTKVGIPPLDPIYQNPPISTFSINVPAGWTSYSNVINGYTYYTIFPANVNSQYGTGNLTITGNSAPVDIFTVGSGGIPSQTWSTTAPGDYYATGGSGGQTSFISNVKLGTGTYNLKFSQPYFPPVPGTGNPPPFPTWYGGNVAITYSNSTPILSSLGGNTLARYGYQDEYLTILGNVSGGFGNGGANPPPGGWGGINGAGGAPDPWGGVITWVGQPAANGLAFFGAGAGGIYNFNTLPPYPLTGVGGLGGAGNALPYGVSTTAGCYGLPGSGGGGAWRGGNFSGVDDLLTQGSGAIIIRKYPDQSLYTPTTWSNLQPNTGSISSNTVVWVSSALATSNTATGNATSLSWTMPAQISGNTGANGANGTPGVSTYSFTVYTASPTQPSTPQANTGSWNFSTNSGTAPLGTGWVLSPPNPQPNEVVWSSTAIATTSNANVAVTNLTWSTPSQVSGQRGVFSSAYVVTPSDPTFYTATQFTANFSAPRTNTTPPIGTGYTPITGDTATFTYRPTNTVVTKTFYANLNQWLSANTQVISGNLFVSNSITASALITTDVYPLNITSQNATIGNIQSPGFWMQASTGNARFGGNISIGNNLIVGNNALFGNNMIIGNSLAVGNNASIGNNLTVGNNTVIGNSLAVGNNASIGNNLTVGNNTVIGNSLDIGNNAIVGNAMAIGNYLTVGTNASIGNNLFIGNNAIIGNSASIGANLIVGQSASIGANLIVGNNAVIGGNLTILGLVSGGNLSANVVNTTNIAYNAITATQMAPLSIASAALQSASLLSRMFAPNSVPPSALSPAASVQLITVIDSSGTSISDPTLDEFYDFGPSVTLTVNPGDQILISVTGTAILDFDDTVPYVSEFTTTFKIIGTNPDSSVNDSGEQIAYWMNWAEFDASVQTNYQTVEHTFTATQAGTMTFSLQFAYGYTDNLGADPNALRQDGATTMVGLLAPYTG